MRSPSFFEDVIKTVTSCNVTWPSTIIMNTRLCRVVGARSRSGLFAFPTPERLARVRPATLRARCTVGYRDARIVELARMFAAGRRASAPGRAGATQADAASGAIDSEFFERYEAEGGASDDDLFELLQEWPGIGPYAAANILQLLGRYSRLPLDTESVRHGRTVLGMKGNSARIMRRMHRHFDPFGAHKFRAYWFELWCYYEVKRGPAWTWERETTGKTFTAALLD
jgi:3-methyladenine DNA glycosylase/8-oxoguanine DNA glycosylase